MRVRLVQPENDEWTHLIFTDDTGMLITALASANAPELI